MTPEWRARLTRWGLARQGFVPWGTRLGAGVLALALLVVALDRLFPPDLRRWQERSTLVTDEGGEVLRAFITADGAWRLPMSATEANPTYLAMLLAYEDHRFYHHPGVDPLALARAAGQALRHGRIVSGGSTLTMQVARLLEPRPRTVVSKLVEMARALQLEAHYSKSDILGMYLTLAPFGGNLEGARAASLAYFGRPPAALTPGQAALLVTLPQSPTKRRPDLAPAAARAGRDALLRRMAAKGVLSRQAAREGMSEPLPTDRRPLPFLAPHLADRLRRAALPGSVIASTLDAGLQRRVEATVRGTQDTLEPAAEVAVLVMEIGSRKVRAYVGGSFTGPFGQVDMAAAPRSPGSALKPFLYGLGFEALPLHPETRINDVPTVFGDYAPRNFDGGFHGLVTVREALQQSLNVPAVKVLDRLGPARFLGRLREVGAQVMLPRPDAAPGLPLALGGLGLSLADLTNLYADLGDGGQARPLVLTPSEAPGTKRPAKRLMGAVAAWYVADILSGTPRPDGRAAVGERWVAYKTGTSYGFRDAWAVGFTPTHVVGVWVGRPDGTPRPGAAGRDMAAPLLFRLVDLLPDRGTPPEPPPGVLEAGPGHALPPALALFDRGTPGGSLAAAAAPLRIAFPPDGAELERTPGRDGAPVPVPLEALGGRPPLRWLVNGLPLPDSASGEGADWIPDGIGFADIAVIDAAGQRAKATVRVR
ncbi:penicillin-binding protein 1C [Nitrospirillum amazonense]|uniref:penicillin-binding protein 1C n=1 Tax=Nitrospirillum amazonense TaxID=28077 RepID=UPI002412D308|nr:penicillin-binding protein 1C [Nitrospirillum amazonense]MDG3441145.1 penicillin-binding protein 1C [Nitrospirillum amazonense]